MNKNKKASRLNSKFYIPYSCRAGQAALELIIALGVLVFSVSASIMVAFGNQSVSVDTGTNGEALLIAGRMLGEARADSKAVFSSVNSISSEELIYFSELLVSDVSQCKKFVSSVTSWNTSPSRGQEVRLSTIFADADGAVALGSDCDSNGPGGPWNSPGSYDFSDPVHPGSAGLDIDVIKRPDGRFALLASDKLPAKETLWMIDVTDPENTPPWLTGAYDTGEDLFAVDATKTHAFVAGAGADQFQVIDITDSSALSLAAAMALPDAPTGIGRSIYYYGDKAYVGTQYLPCPSCPGGQNNELHIFDVSNPESPSWEASIKVNRNVNDIMVRDGLAYLAIGPGGTGDVFRIYDVNPSSPTYLDEIGNFIAPGDEQGTGLYLLGNKVYLGRERTPAARNDFYILDVSSPASVAEIWSSRLELNPNTEVVGIHVSGNLAFISTSDTTPSSGGGPFIIFDVSDPANPFPIIACPFNYSEKTTGLDFMDGLIFTSNESQDSMRIIYPALVCS